MNMLFWVTLFIVLYPQIIKPHTWGKGKYLTMPLRRWFPKLFDHYFCRTIQVLIALGLDIGLYPIWHSIEYLYYIAMAAWAIDDWFSDDDTWKRFKDWARNKIKWKMKLPQPVVGKVAS